MDLKIRNLPAKTIVSLDELAKQHSQSREAYLRDLLNHHVMYHEVEGLHLKYENLVQSMSKDWITALERNTQALKEFKELNGVMFDD